MQLDHLGDAVLTTPMLRALRERFPEAMIDVVASRSNWEVFHGNPHVRQVHVSQRNWQSRDRTNGSYLAEVFRLARLLRPIGYDLGIDPRGDLLVALVLLLAAIPRRLGWTAGGGGFLLTDTAQWNPARHEIESRFALVEPLAVRGNRMEPELFPSWADRYAVRELLAALPGPASPLVVLHTSAGTPAKSWPISHQSELLDPLARELQGSFVLVGDIRDRGRSRQLAQSSRRTVDCTGQLSLMQLAALLEEADLFIGPDSGPAHVASAMGTPSIVLFSGTNRVDCWRPWGERVRVLRSPVPCSPCHLKVCPLPGHPCMSGIRPADVVEMARQMLSATRPTRAVLSA
ncbi:MAG: glycosyltransferase family 9 protein [Planctomycetes bacterium]|nr:glycosyltransferase family 9 protein [Planctomycetota bacterium]